jgi:hypothetical protein
VTIRLYTVNRKQLGPTPAVVDAGQLAALPNFGEPPPPAGPDETRAAVCTLTGDLAESMAAQVAVKLAVELGQRTVELYEVEKVLEPGPGSSPPASIEVGEREKLIGVLRLDY